MKLYKILAIILLMPMAIFAEYSASEIPLGSFNEILSISENGNFIVYSDEYSLKIYSIQKNVSKIITPTAKLNIINAIVNNEGIVAGVFKKNNNYAQGIFVFKNKFEELPVPCAKPTEIEDGYLRYLTDKGELLVHLFMDYTSECWAGSDYISYIYNVHTKETTYYLDHDDFLNTENYPPKQKFFADGHLIATAEKTYKLIDAELTDFLLNYSNVLLKNSLGIQVGSTWEFNFIWYFDNSYQVIPKDAGEPVKITSNGSILFKKFALLNSQLIELAPDASHEDIYVTWTDMNNQGQVVGSISAFGLPGDAIFWEAGKRLRYLEDLVINKKKIHFSIAVHIHDKIVFAIGLDENYDQKLYRLTIGE